jgi:hypothetical protein
LHRLQGAVVRLAPVVDDRAALPVRGQGPPLRSLDADLMTPTTGGDPMPDPEATAPRKTFTSFLHEQRGGVLHAELTDALAELVAKVAEHEKGGTLTLKITIKPEADGAVKVADEVAIKAPRPASRPSLFFTDSSGNLSRRNPRQPELPLREIHTPQDEEEVS